jgi:hypothetical protein
MQKSQEAASLDSKVKTQVSGCIPAYKLLLGAIKQATVLCQTDEPERKKVASLAGFHNCKSSTVANGFTKQKNFLIEYPSSSTISLTQAGHDQAGPVELPTNEQNLENIKQRLKGPKAIQILDILLE